MRCLRALGRDQRRRARRCARSPDDAARTAAEKAATVAPVAARRPPATSSINARWDGGADLDVSLVAPDGTRVSWMGGRTDVAVADVDQHRARAARDQHAPPRQLPRRDHARRRRLTRPLRGTLDISVLGTRKSLPFELAGSRLTVGRIGVSLEEHLETIDTDTIARVAFGNIPHPRLRQIMLARSPSVKQCCITGLQDNPNLAGSIVLTISIDDFGSTQTRTSQAPALNETAACIQQQLASMHVEGSAPQLLRVPLTLRAQ